MNMWFTDAVDGGCGSRLDFAPMHAIRSVGQCDYANDFRHEYQTQVWTLNPSNNNKQNAAHFTKQIIK